MVVQARVGGPVYGTVYGAAPVVVSPAPVWMPPPPPVVMAPRVIMPAPVYRPGWWGDRRGHGHGHGHGAHGDDAHDDDLHDVNIFEWIAWTPFLIAIVVFGVYPQLMFKVIDPAVQVALKAFGG